MNDDYRPARHPAIETVQFGAEAVLYDERSGTVHHLNSSACAIWTVLDGRPISDVVDTLCQSAGVRPADMRRDVLQALSEFGAADLLAD
jgi:PqqD family protein of HPr-rel-A system